MKSLDTLNQQLDFFLSAPKDHAEITQLCIRPESLARVFPASIELSVERGAIGDKWEFGAWMSLPDGSPDPEVQVSILPKRIYDEICVLDDALHPGDTIIADIDTSAENLPIGTQLQIGTAIIEVGSVPNYGCAKWAQRYGDDALRFISKQAYHPYHLRGVLCKIVKDGVVTVGDTILKCD